MSTLFKSACAVVAAVWVSLNPMVQALLVLMGLDIVTGTLVAFSTRTLSSNISLRGAVKKAAALILVGAAAYMEPRVQEATGTTLPIAAGVAGFFVAHEGLSLLENAAKAGVPIPTILKDALAKLGGKL